MRQGTRYLVLYEFDAELFFSQNVSIEINLNITNYDGISGFCLTCDMRYLVSGTENKKFSNYKNRIQNAIENNQILD